MDISQFYNPSYNRHTKIFTLMKMICHRTNKLFNCHNWNEDEKQNNKYQQ